jgi:hypothetical protein
MKKQTGIISLLVFAATIVIIAILQRNPGGLFHWGESAAPARPQTRTIIPQAGFDRDGGALSEVERIAREDSLSARVALAEGEVIATLLTQDLDGDLQDEQIIAYRVNAGTGAGAESPVYITYVDFDPASGGFKRLWNVATGATRPGTVALSIQDVIGDRSNCIVVTGMNGAGQHTLTILRREDGADEAEAWRSIAGLRIDGTITIQEPERSQAYRMGQTTGQSFTIAAYGRDPDSDNILDQIEIIYRYHEGRGRFEQEKLTRIPGSQMEQRRVRELLSGGAKGFEDFISGLWYHVGPQGTLNLRQYIYFDPLNRELIFCSDETQQVFSWNSSSATRYGLYVSSQNVSVTTLRRFIDIELESLSSIKVKVVEDVRLNISVNDSWDGSYRKADSRETGNPDANTAPAPWLEAAYDGSIGKLAFHRNGVYELAAGNRVLQGNYTFFLLDNRVMLELRPGAVTGNVRDTWLVEYPVPAALSLTRVIISTRGLQPAHEAAVTLTRVEDTGSP